MHLRQLVSRSQIVTLAVTVWTTAVERFVLSSPGNRVGDKCEQTKRSTAIVRTLTASVTIWLRETIGSLVSPRMIIIKDRKNISKMNKEVGMMLQKKLIQVE